jgi:hypothetical protein
VSRLRALLRRLDPWAALLLGGLVAMGVVILLATPGPWHRVVGPRPRVELASPPPDDLAVFVAGASGRCAGVVWLHVDFVTPALTAVVVPRLTQGYVAGGGYAPLARLADDLGPAAAAAALGEAVGTGMDAWVSLDRKAFMQAVAPLSPDIAGQGPSRALLRGLAAWAGGGEPTRVWTRQYQALRQALPLITYDQMNVVAFANYVLGFGHVRSDLDLQGATSLGRAIQGLTSRTVSVVATPAIVETCRGVDWWRLDFGSVERLRQSLAFGLRPPASEPSTVRRPKAARVLVILPEIGAARTAYLDVLRRGLAASASAPVEVLAVAGDPPASILATVAAERPLAVLDARALGGGDTAELEQALRDTGKALQALRQPAVIAVPPGSPATVIAAARAAGPPLSPPTGEAAVAATPTAGLDAAAARRLARVHVATLVRACWPGVLAPRAAATREDYPYAARGSFTTSVIGGTDTAGDEALAARLGQWGWDAAAGEGGWQPPAWGGRVFFAPGMRRAALALAGDLGLPWPLVTGAEDAPAPVTVVWPE